METLEAGGIWGGLETVWNGRKVHEITEDMESEFVKYTEHELEWLFHSNHFHDH